MSKITYETILSYAERIKKTHPEISDNDLKKAITAYFIGGKDVFQFSKMGAVNIPFIDTIAIISIVYNSLKKVITQDKAKLNKIQDDINRAVEYLSSIK